MRHQLPATGIAVGHHWHLEHWPCPGLQSPFFSPTLYLCLCRYGIPSLMCAYEAARHRLPGSSESPRRWQALPSAAWAVVVAACVAVALPCLAPAAAAWRADGFTNELLEHESIRECGGLAIVAAFAIVNMLTWVASIALSTSPVACPAPSVLQLGAFTHSWLLLHCMPPP